MSHAKIAYRLIALFLSTAITLSIVPASSADVVTVQGNATGHKYRGGVAGQGDISYAAGLQVTRNAVGVVKVRAVGRITKRVKVRTVQIDSVVLGTSTAAIAENNAPRGSASGGAATSSTAWKAVPTGVCASYRARVNYSIRWSDGKLSKFTVLSPISKVCGQQPPKPKPPVVAPPKPKPAPGPPAEPADRNCSDFSTQAAAQAFFEHYYPYYGDFSHLDADHDGIACESLS